MRPPHGAEGLTPLSVKYLDGSRSLQELAPERVMAVIEFGAETRVDSSDPRRLTIALTELGPELGPKLGGRGTIELWYSSKPVQVRFSEGICCISNEDALFAHLLVPETDYQDLAAATCVAYQRILAVIQRQGYPHLLRVWNYLADIHRHHHDLDRYQTFCEGRYRALESKLADFEPKLPAASALGTKAGAMLIYGLASKTPGMQVENPRQISAFRYPPQYGPKSPSFSRAVLKDWGAGERHLYISGTASILGHATAHLQDPLAQAQETLNNLEALVERASRHTGMPFHMSLLKVYVRQHADLTALRELIGVRFGSATPILFLQADVCRRDLMVEIEGIAVSGHARGAKH